MKAFWWFSEDSIAGMARPGFNLVHWFELPFDEAAVLGWLGQQPPGVVSLESFRTHVRTYLPKIYKFHRVSEQQGAEALKFLREPQGMAGVLERLQARTQILKSFAVIGDELHFELNQERLNHEIEFLRSKGVRRVVSLTEHHHSQDTLQKHFDLHHIGIEDLSAPRIEQVQELVEVIKSSKRSGEIVAVHCLAGIGRTSTMLLAAHLLMGEKFQDLQARIKKQNPSFVPTDPQAQFLHALT